MVGRFFYENAVACWVYNKNTLQIVDVNKQCLNLYGYSDYEFTSCLSVAELAPRKHRPIFERYLKRNSDTNPVVHRQIRKDGTCFPAIVLTQPLKKGDDFILVMVIETTRLSFGNPEHSDFLTIASNITVFNTGYVQLN